MSITSGELENFKFAKNRPATSTAIYCPTYAGVPIAREFGWYWEITDEIDFITKDLHRRGRVFNVWETPQFQAIEWLAGQKKLRFPPFMDAGLHGAFLKILSINAICTNPIRHGDVVAALEKLDSAGKKIASAADDIIGIAPEVIDYLTSAPPTDLALSIERMNQASGSYSMQIGVMKGILQVELKHQNEIYEKFTGGPLTENGGRPANWIARFVAIQAADIYRTTFPGPITPMAGRPSYLSFLERFSQGIPDAERADKRALARQVWKGGYTGVPFAPVG